MDSGAHSVDRFDWHLDSLDDPDALARYRDAVAGFYDVRVETRADGRFYNRLEAYRTGDAILAHCRSVSQQFHRSRALAARDGVDHVQVILQIEGHHTGEYDGRSTEAAPGTIRLLDLARPYESRGEEYALLDLVVPREALPPALIRRDVHGLVIDGGPGARLLRSHLQSLWQERGQLTADQAAQAIEAGMALLGAAVLDAAPAVEPHYREALARTLLGNARRLIRTRLSDPALSPAAIAAGLGLSERTLYRLFEPAGGVAAYVQAIRLDQAFRALSAAPDERRSISEIVYRHGFRSTAHFSRLFRQRFGVRPSDIRRGEVRAAEAGGELATLATWAGDFRR